MNIAYKEIVLREVNLEAGAEDEQASVLLKENVSFV